MFGVERLQGLLRKRHTHGIDDILQDVESAVKQFRGATEPFDDATMMVLRLDG
jgi:serine phosphatase RsbU (regulator of sigma subunit)